MLQAGRAARHGLKLFPASTHHAKTNQFPIALGFPAMLCQFHFVHPKPPAGLQESKPRQRVETPMMPTIARACGGWVPQAW